MGYVFLLLSLLNVTSSIDETLFVLCPLIFLHFSLKLAVGVAPQAVCWQVLLWAPWAPGPIGCWLEVVATGEDAAVSPVAKVAQETLLPLGCQLVSLNQQNSCFLFLCIFVCQLCSSFFRLRWPVTLSKFFALATLWYPVSFNLNSVSFLLPVHPFFLCSSPWSPFSPPLLPLFFSSF